MTTARCWPDPKLDDSTSYYLWPAVILSAYLPLGLKFPAKIVYAFLISPSCNLFISFCLHIILSCVHTCILTIMHVDIHTRVGPRIDGNEHTHSAKTRAHVFTHIYICCSDFTAVNIGVNRPCNTICWWHSELTQCRCQVLLYACVTLASL
jgi:hypothetical protein